MDRSQEQYAAINNITVDQQVCGRLVSVTTATMYILDDRFASFEKVSKSAFSLGEFRDSHNQR